MYRIDANGEIMLNITARGDYIVMADEYSALPGDVNNDGVLTALDASAILKDIAGIARCANAQAGDVNGDGSMNALDASAILARIVH